MPSRMSNRDRIQRMAAEAEATAREKAEKGEKTGGTKAAKAKKKAPPRPKKKAAAGTSRPKSGKKRRVKIVWTVGVPAGKTVQTFPYREKAEAEAEAERLTEKKKTLHVVRSERVPMTDEE